MEIKEIIYRDSKRTVAEGSLDIDSNRQSLLAGPLRNREMAEYADALILIWDRKSPGSKSMLNIACQEGLHIRQFILDF